MPVHAHGALPPALDLVVVQVRAGIVVAHAKIFGAPAGAQVDGRQGRHFTGLVAQTVGVALSQLPVGVDPPAFHAGVVQEGAGEAFATHLHLHSIAAGAHIDRRDGVQIGGDDACGVVLSQEARSVYDAPAFQVVVVQDRAASVCVVLILANVFDRAPGARVPDRV